MATEAQDAPDWRPQYSPWRHGGWYVDNLHYPSGAVGCVSRNYADRKWRIACDPRPFEEQPTFKTRDDAARGERDLIAAMESTRRDDARRARAVELANERYALPSDDDLEIVGDVDSVDGGYWIAARVWVPAEDVEPTA